MSSNFVPTRDAQFNDFAQDFLAALAAQPVEYGFTAEEITELTVKVNGWSTSYTDSRNQRDAAKAAVSGKDNERKSLEDTIREYARQIQANPKVSDELKLEAGLPVHSTSRTPTPVPDTAPLVMIESLNVLEHTIRIIDEAHPTRRARPDGAASCEVLCFVGNEHPTEIKEYHTAAISTKMMQTIEFDVADGGKTAWYRFRWVGTRGDFGPMSPAYTATITQ